MKIVIGLPAYNEEENLPNIITQLKKITDKIIVCNDGSSDQTGPTAERMGATVVNHAKNMGYGASIKSLFTKFADTDGDILVTFDADGQHRIEDIQRVIDPILKNEADIVIGSRFWKKTDKKYPHTGNLE